MIIAALAYVAVVAQGGLPASVAAVAADTDGGRVVLAFPRDDVIVAEAALRLAAELRQAHAQVEQRPCLPAQHLGCPSLAGLAQGSAGIALGRRGAAIAIEVRIELASGGSMSRTWGGPDTPAADEPQALAIQAVELLRLVREEAAVRKGGAPPPAAGVAAGAAPPSEVPAGRQVTICATAGLAILTSRDGLGGVVGPILALGARLPSGLEAGVELLGPWFHSGLAATFGSASVRQESLGFLLASHRILPRLGRFAPRLLVGAGGYRLTATGHSMPENLGIERTHLTLFAQVGAGLRVELPASFALNVEARLLWLRQAVALFVAGEHVGNTERLNLVGAINIARGF